MKYKNVAALLAAAMMALTLLAGCAKGGAENDCSGKRLQNAGHRLRRAETRRQRNCGVGGGL